MQQWILMVVGCKLLPSEPSSSKLQTLAYQHVKLILQDCAANLSVFLAELPRNLRY